jgi:arsenate reductase-like glutaredoxin family protein
VWNPAASFPTIVIDNQRSIVGFKEDEIREALKK